MSTTAQENSSSRRSAAKPRWLVLLLLGMVPVLLWFTPLRSGIERWDLGAADQLMRLRHRHAPQPVDPRIVVVGLTQQGEALFEEDLETRQAWIEALRVLSQNEVAVTGFDIFFERPRRYDDFLAMQLTRLPTVLGYKFQSADVTVEPEGEPPADLSIALALAEAGEDPAVLLELARGRISDYIVLLQDTARGELSSADRAELLQRLAWTRATRDRLLERWFLLAQGRPYDKREGGDPVQSPAVVLLSPALLPAASSLGFANVLKDEEEVIRHTPLVYRWRDALFPNIALAMALEYHGAAFRDVRIEWGSHLEYTPTRNGDGAPVRIPMDERGRYRVNFRGGEEFLTAQPSLAVLVHGSLAEERSRQRIEERLQGAIVLFGEVITGGEATDTQPIPLQPRFPMVGLHANVLDNILRRDFLRVLPPISSPIAMASVGLLLALLFRIAPPRLAMALGLVLGVLWIALAGGLFVWAGVLLPMAPPVLAFALSLLGMSGYAIAVAESDRRLVREVLGRTVSPKIGEELLRHFDNEALWGSEREITILFVDIRGYTTMSEELPPAELLRLLGTFYDQVSEAVFAQDGQVNKFIGDAVLALFGALPEEPANHAERALRAAVAIQRAMHDLAEGLQFQSLGLRLRTGAGINTGMATVGIVGRRETRIEYTAIGDNVNVASRLQGLAGENQIAIAAETVAAVGGAGAPLFAQLRLRLEPADTLAVKGRRKTVEVFRAHLQEPS